MRVIDFHTHCWPDAIAPAAIASLERKGTLTAFYDGSVTGLLGAMDDSGVALSVIQPVATKPGQVRGINDWAATLLQGPMASRVLPFGAMHPDVDDPAEEIARMAALGLRGIKLHPEHQEFAPDEPRMAAVYEAAIAHDMTVFFHAGADELHDTVRGTPATFAAMLDGFPGMRVILAHMGGFRVWNDVADKLVGRDVYFDTAYTLGHLPDADFVNIVRAHGGQRILFGSDGPWTDSCAEIAWLRRLPMGRDIIEAVLGENAERLLAR